MQSWMRDAVLKLTGQYADQPLQHTGMLTKVLSRDTRPPIRVGVS